MARNASGRPHARRRRPGNSLAGERLDVTRGVTEHEQPFRRQRPCSPREGGRPLPVRDVESSNGREAGLGQNADGGRPGEPAGTEPPKNGSDGS